MKCKRREFVFFLYLLRVLNIYDIVAYYVLNTKGDKGNNMGKIKLYHGTSMEAARDILKNGFCDINRSWSCSNSTQMYFYANNECCVDDEDDYYRNAMNLAFEAGCVTASLRKSPAEYVSILEIIIDEDLVEDDNSCENMAYCGARQVDLEDLRGIDIIEHKCKYFPSMGLMYLTGCIRNNYLDLQNSLIGDYEIRLIRESERLGIYIEGLFVRIDH